ncbi:DNA helicase [Pararhizobium gei]|uniref:DNA helicase n=1 Tax=Pararhizobium gei TaxID=1395951 RepID=UPI0023D99C5A|nr:DNA helicase [Rhizobium gei]
MKLSESVFRLKRKAKLLSRSESIRLHEALRRVAVEEGYTDWSLLVAKSRASSHAELFARLKPGDLVLVAARPGQGKTLLALKLALEAMRSGNRAAFFTLEYTERDIADRFQAIGADHAQYAGLFACDCSDDIHADYIIRVLASAPPRTLVVIDYLQLLDQKRRHPDLGEQVRALRTFSRDRDLIMVFISQIDRSYNPSLKPYPDLSDVRLPNPLDLRLFDKTCFLGNGEVRFQGAD